MHTIRYYGLLPMNLDTDYLYMRKSDKKGTENIEYH